MQLSEKQIKAVIGRKGVFWRHPSGMIFPVRVVAHKVGMGPPPQDFFKVEPRGGGHGSAWVVPGELVQIMTPTNEGSERAMK